MPGPFVVVVAAVAARREHGASDFGAPRWLVAVEEAAEVAAADAPAV